MNLILMMVRGRRHGNSGIRVKTKALKRELSAPANFSWTADLDVLSQTRNEPVRSELCKRVSQIWQWPMWVGLIGTCDRNRKSQLSQTRNTAAATPDVYIPPQ
jgi:hypothetical protein